MNLQAWRVVRSGWAPDAFSGEGARLHQGRWNHRGTPMVYTSGTLSLAALEILANVRLSVLLADFVSIPVTFDASLCVRLGVEELPPGWNAPAPPSTTRDIGTAWVRDRSSVVLAVPSAVVPVEVNYLLNPEHPDFGQIAIGSPEPFQFDPRLFGGA